MESLSHTNSFRESTYKICKMSSSSLSSSSCTKKVKLCGYMVRRYCCGDITVIGILMTLKNSCRRFYRCDNFLKKDCKFFNWLDKEFSQRAKDVINGYILENVQMRRQIRVTRDETYEGHEVIKLNVSKLTSCTWIRK